MLVNQVDMTGGCWIGKTGSKAAGFIFAHIHIGEYFDDAIVLLFFGRRLKLSLRYTISDIIQVSILTEIMTTP